MSLRTRDIEDLIRRYGTEKGLQKAVMLLTEAVVAQQESLMDFARIVDMQSAMIERLANVSINVISATDKIRRTLGHDIDEEGISSEPISDIGETGGKQEH